MLCFAVLHGFHFGTQTHDWISRLQEVQKLPFFERKRKQYLSDMTMMMRRALLTLGSRRLATTTPPITRSFSVIYDSGSVTVSMIESENCECSLAAIQ